MRSALNLKKGSPMRRNRNFKTVLPVNGIMVEVVSISGLAKIIGRSRDTILRYERTDVFPLAPIMKGSYRYYPVSLAKRLVPLVGKIPRNKKVDSTVLVEISKLFKEERDKLCRGQK